MTTVDLTPRHFDLGELITRLRAEPDPSRRVPIGFKGPHSYRGYYEQLAFEIAEDVTVGEMLAAAESARDVTFQGWKGGDYVMDVCTEVWLVGRAGDLGETLGAVLLELMLDGLHARRWKTLKDTPAYRAGREDALRQAADDFEAHLRAAIGLRPEAELYRGDRAAVDWLRARADQRDQPRTVSGGEQGDNPEERNDG